MKNQKKLYFIILGIILLVSILPLLLFPQRIGITKYAIPAICLFVFHLGYGLLAYIFQHKGNFLLYHSRFLFHLDFYLFFTRDKEITYTKGYEQYFNRLLAIYFLSLPLYLPCILLTATPAVMPLALIAFLLPQAFFIVKDVQEKIGMIKSKQFRKQRIEQERVAQEKREEMGQWK